MYHQYSILFSQQAARCLRRNTHRLIGCIYTLTAQQKKLLEMEVMVCLSGSQQDKQLATQMLQAENVQISKQKPQHFRMQ